MTAVVTLDGVSRSYRTRAEVIHAVTAASLELVAGTVTALIGPSGSGKSTLINLIVGWELHDSGRIIWNRDVGADWQSVSVVPQGLGLLPELTIRENIGLPSVLGNPARYTVAELAAALGLVDVLDQLPESVSLGEHQRAAAARALICQPKLLVADEPTAHQDEANTRRVADLLGAAAAAGSAVLVTTHDPRLLASATRVIEILDGNLSDAEA